MCLPFFEVYFCRTFLLIFCVMFTLQALKATSREKSTFLRRERDAWVAWQDERATGDAAEGELTRECEVSADLQRRCSELKTEARDARVKVC